MLKRPLPFALALMALMALMALFAAAALPARAEDVPSTVLLIDGSGSMWGRFEADKRAKIDVVRELLKAKIAAAGKINIGLASFGHRRKGDCSDVEVIADPGAPRETVLLPLEKLNPRGKGPLVSALRESVAALGQSRPASVLVINDGIDNCQQDACAAAEEIAKTAPGVAIHMISIGIDPAEIPRVACVAKSTGGMFFDVKDAAGLATAIDQAARLAMQTPGDAAPSSASAAAARTPAVPAGASLSASAALAEGGAAVTQSLSWRIFKSGSTEALAEAEGPDFAARLDPGAYDIDVDNGRVRARQTVELAPGRTLGVVVPLNAARLRVLGKTGKDSGLSDLAVVSIEPNPAQADARATWIGRASAADVVLPAGTYAVSLSEGLVRQSMAVTLKAGGDITLDLLLDSGRLDVSAAAREDGGALDDVTYVVSTDDPDSADGRREVARSHAATASFKLPAGTYYVTARSGSAETRQRIAVSAGETVKRVLVLPLARVKISTLIGGQPAGAAHGIVYRVSALDGDKRDVLNSVQPQLDILLAPGRYKVAARLDAHHIATSQDITVEAGKPADVVLKIEAAEISLVAPAGASTATGETFWEIFDGTGKPIWRSTAAEPKAWLAPGRYALRFEARDKRTEAAFEVRAGERRVIQMGGPLGAPVIAPLGAQPGVQPGAPGAH